MSFKTTKHHKFLTRDNIKIALILSNIMFTASLFSYINYSNQLALLQRDATQNLIKTINMGDEIDDNRTKSLLEATVKNENRNYKVLSDLVTAQNNNTNATITSVKFLSDNFGVNSDYLERENNYRNLTLRNQEDIIKNQCTRLHQLNLKCENHINESGVD